MRGQVFRHYKGDRYVVVAEARMSEDRAEQVIVYQSLKYPERIWVRPRAMFLEVMPDGRRRFEPAELEDEDVRCGCPESVAFETERDALLEEVSAWRRLHEVHEVDAAGYLAWLEGEGGCPTCGKRAAEDVTERG